MKEVILHTHQTCLVTFVTRFLVEDDYSEEDLDELSDHGMGDLLGISIGDGVSDPSDEWEPEDIYPSVFYPEKPPEHIRKVMDISTGHLTQEMAERLTDWGDLDVAAEGGAIAYNKGEVGMLVYVPSELGGRESKPLITDDLWALMVYAHREGCDWIMFDRDGVVLDEFPEFGW